MSQVKTSNGNGCLSAMRCLKPNFPLKGLALLFSLGWARSRLLRQWLALGPSFSPCPTSSSCTGCPKDASGAMCWGILLVTTRKVPYPLLKSQTRQSRNPWVRYMPQAGLGGDDCYQLVSRVFPCRSAEKGRRGKGGTSISELRSRIGGKSGRNRASRGSPTLTSLSGEHHANPYKSTNLFLRDVAGGSVY